MIYDFYKISREQLVKKYAGGKGYNLFLLTKNNLPVPDFVILGSNAFKKFLEEKGLAAKIGKYVKSLDRNMSMDQGNGIHEKIEKMFMECPFPEDVEHTIDGVIEGFGKRSISVRSSAGGEDSAANSFAGQLSSYLYLNDQNHIKTAIKKCWASAYSGRSLSYRLNRNLTIDGLQMGVVLQEMIDPDVSGVMFTQNTVNNKPKEIFISSVYGPGEGLVSGALDADTFLVDREMGTIKEKIAYKRGRFSADPENPGYCREVSVSREMAKQPTLSITKLKDLAKLGLNIENLYHYPQDIEFAIKDKLIYILQSRPITSISNQEILQPKGEIRIWDNSNIVESYSGVTSPLTFSLASYAYEQVYIQLCEVMGVPKRVIESNSDMFKNMIGIIDGNIYYNLINWYKLLSLFPSFKSNKSAMETMMGVSETLPTAVSDALGPPLSEMSLVERFARLKVGFHLLRYHFKINKLVMNFFDDFKSIYDQYNSYNYSQMSMDQIVTKFRSIREKMLLNWKIPLINDFLTMVHFGLLKKFSDTWCKDLGGSIHNDLLSGEAGIESVEPTHKLVELAAAVVRNKALKTLFATQDTESIFEIIQRNPDFVEFNGQIEEYLQKFGFRCMNELKLEEIDLNTDPCNLFIMIKNYMRSGQTDLSAFKRNEKRLRVEAERKIDQHLNGYKKRIFLWVLKHARNSVKNRENLRFARTRVFGLTRTMFQGIGEDLSRKNLLACPSDVFYLTVEELLAFSEGRSTLTNLIGLCNLRKEECNSYKEMEEPDSRFFTRGVVYSGNFWNKREVVIEDGLPEGTLKGLPCSPGKATGKAKVILSTKDDLTLSGEILVTARTDPGWVPLFPLISGLLIERGSLLSHSAIVARELGVPTIIKVKNLLDQVKTGDSVTIDGSNGIICKMPNAEL